MPELSRLRQIAERPIPEFLKLHGGGVTDINTTLEERHNRYGTFAIQASIARQIKAAMAVGNWNDLADDQKEALDTIATKIARILNGDPNYHDSWHDIVGYAKLVADRLAK